MCQSVDSLGPFAPFEELSRGFSTGEPGSLLKAAIKLIHLLGIVLGLGAATVLDLVLLRFLLTGTITRSHVDLVGFVSGIVALGLAFLWVSGGFYLLHYLLFDPERITNQKVWAKITIVAILTLNGHLIHRRVLPLVQRQMGRTLFSGVGHAERSTFVAFGAVSATSWYVPLFLGAVPHLNFVVSAPTILLAYATILVLAVASTIGIGSVWHRHGGFDAGPVQALRS